MRSVFVLDRSIRRGDLLKIPNIIVRGRGERGTGRGGNEGNTGKIHGADGVAKRELRADQLAVIA